MLKLKGAVQSVFNVWCILVHFHKAEYLPLLSLSIKRVCAHCLITLVSGLYSECKVAVCPRLHNVHIQSGSVLRVQSAQNVKSFEGSRSDVSWSLGWSVHGSTTIS